MFKTGEATKRRCASVNSDIHSVHHVKYRNGFPNKGNLRREITGGQIMEWANRERSVAK